MGSASGLLAMFVGSENVSGDVGSVGSEWMLCLRWRV